MAPKRAALAGAQAELASTQAILNEAKAKLDEVEQGIATLQEKYTQCNPLITKFLLPPLNLSVLFYL